MKLSVSVVYDLGCHCKQEHFRFISSLHADVFSAFEIREQKKPTCCRRCRRIFFYKAVRGFVCLLLLKPELL